MVLSETRGHMAISGRARGHMVGQDPRLLRHVGRLLILMLARDREIQDPSILEQIRGKGA